MPHDDSEYDKMSTPDLLAIIDVLDLSSHPAKLAEVQKVIARRAEAAGLSLERYTQEEAEKAEEQKGLRKGRLEQAAGSRELTGEELALSHAHAEQVLCGHCSPSLRGQQTVQSPLVVGE